MITTYKKNMKKDPKLKKIQNIKNNYFQSSHKSIGLSLTVPGAPVFGLGPK